MSGIVVGVSGKDTSHPAIDWAVDYAAGSTHSVDLIHVVDISWGAATMEFTDAALSEAEQKLDAEEARARALSPHVTVSSSVRIGSPTRELVAAADAASLLVIGSRRSHEGAEHAASRRPARIAAAASCSVVVVPVDSERGSGVVVGVDGSEDSAAAVTFAAREADRFGEPLTVIYSWFAPQPWADSTASLLWPTEPREEDRLVVTEAIAGLADMYPDLDLRTDVVVADPVNALRHGSAGARLLVVGSRGRHGFTKALLGSVSEQLVWALPCPVAVIRAEG